MDGLLGTARNGGRNRNRALHFPSPNVGNEQLLARILVRNMALRRAVDRLLRRNRLLKRRLASLQRRAPDGT